MNIYIRKIRPVGVYIDEDGKRWYGELQDKEKWYDEKEKKNLKKLYKKRLEDRRFDHYVDAKIEFKEKYIKIDLHELLDRLSGVEK